MTKLKKETMCLFTTKGMNMHILTEVKDFLGQQKEIVDKIKSTKTKREVEILKEEIVAHSNEVEWYGIQSTAYRNWLKKDCGDEYVETLSETFVGILFSTKTKQDLVTPKNKAIVGFSCIRVRFISSIEKSS